MFIAAVLSSEPVVVVITILKGRSRFIARCSYTRVRDAVRAEMKDIEAVFYEMT